MVQSRVISAFAKVKRAHPGRRDEPDHPDTLTSPDNLADAYYPAGTWAGPTGQSSSRTGRELQVERLVAARKTNPQIAAELWIEH